MLVIPTQTAKLAVPIDSPFFEMYILKADFDFRLMKKFIHRK